MRDIVRDLNQLYREEPALVFGDIHSDGFEWVAAGDAESSVIAYLRKGKDPADTLLVVGHYTPVVRHNYAVGVPFAGFWREILNSDAREYGGLGEGNLGGKTAEELPWDGRPHSLRLTLPGNSTLIFKHEG